MRHGNATDIRSSLASSVLAIRRTCRFESQTRLKCNLSIYRSGERCDGRIVLPFRGIFPTRKD